MFWAGARASTRRFLLLGGGGLCLAVFVGPGAASWGCLGASRVAAAAKWELGEWIHKSAPESGREAPLAFALRPLQHSAPGSCPGAVTGAQDAG